jgi:hypothetical protein
MERPVSKPKWTRSLPDEVLADLEHMAIGLWNLAEHHRAGARLEWVEAAARIRDAVEEEQADREDKWVRRSLGNEES